MTNEFKASKIKELFDLFQSGAITKEEFEILKGEILHKRSKSVNKKSGIKKWVWAASIVALVLAGIMFILKMSDTGSGTFTDPRDGETYRWVKIGDQVWMAENLAYRPSSGNYWAYGNDQSNLSKFGYLYDWETACKVCPPGWHLPSDEQWSQLINYVGSKGYSNDDRDSNGAGNALKSCRQVGTPLGGDCITSDHPRWDSDDTQYGFDTFGFSALPGGGRYSVEEFIYIGRGGYWWSATEHASTRAWIRSIRSDIGYVAHFNDFKFYGFSVRCVRVILTSRVSLMDNIDHEQMRIA